MTVPRKEIVDEIADDEERPPASPVYYAAAQHLRRGVPLDVDCSPTIRLLAAQLGPAWRTAWLVFFEHSQPMLREASVVRDRFAKTGATCAVDLDESLHDRA